MADSVHQGKVTPVATADPNSAPPPITGRQIFAFIAALIVLVVGIVVGVRWFNGDFGRSVNAYCNTWKEEGTRLRDKWNAEQRAAQQSDNPFGAMQTVMGSPQDLADFFGDLDKVAPEEIEPAVAQYQRAWQTTADNLGSEATDPLSFLLKQAAVAEMSRGAELQVNAWTKTHCTAN